MKKFVLSILIFIFTLTSAFAEIYPTAGIITEIKPDAFVITDFSGEQWVWEGEAEDLMEGDVVAMLCNDMNTNYLYDDEIILYRYIGFLC